MAVDDRDMLELIDLYLEGGHDADQLAELSAWLTQSRANRDVFARVATLHRQYRDWATAQTDLDEIDASLMRHDESRRIDEEVWQSVLDDAVAAKKRAAIEDKAQRLFAADQEGLKLARSSVDVEVVAGPPRVIVIPRAAVWLGIAAMLGLVAWIGWPRTGANPPAQTASVEPDERSMHKPVYVARIMDSVGAQWEGLEASTSRLEQGKLLVLRQGMAQVTFEDGATVLIEAPATFQPTGPNGMRLVEGRLAAQVPPSGHGFEIVTPQMTVIDLGTEFGVEVDRLSGTATDVFTGRVIAESSSVGHAGRLDLVAGQATRADTAGRLTAVTAADATRFYRDLATFAVAPRVSGQGVYLRSQPARVAFHAFESTEHITVFMERHAVAWEQGWAFDEVVGAEPAVGQPVDVYLAHFDPVGDVELANRDITREVVLHFDRPIVGLITSAERLERTDIPLGHSQTQYPVGLEGKNSQRGMDKAGDAFSIEDAGHTLRLKMQAGTHIDQLRIVVQSQH